MFKSKDSSLRLGIIVGAIVALLTISLACGAEATPAPAPTARPAATVAPTPTTAGAPTPVAGARPVYGGTLRHALNLAAKSLDPHYGREAMEIIVDYLGFNQIVKLDAQLNVVPELAESWTAAADGKSVTFKLKRGVKFHDGTDFNAQAAKWSLDRCLDKEVICSTYGKIEVINKVTADDDYTITIYLTTPWRPILAGLSDLGGFVVSPTAVQKYNSYKNLTGDFGKNPVGTGAFRFSEWVPDNRIVMRKNTSYWETGKPYLDEVVLQHVPDAQTQLAMIRTGETDLIADIAADQVSIIRANPNLKVDEYASGRVYVIRLLSTKPPFNNKALRQAVGFAIDREALIKAIYGGFGRPAYSVIGVGWATNPNIKPLYYDVAKAKQKVAEAGYTGAPIQYRCSSATQSVALCEATQAQLKVVGLNAQIEMVVPADFFGGIREGKYAMGDGFRTPLGDPHLLIDELYRKGGRGNYTGSDNAEVNSLLEQAGVIFDTARAKAVYDQVQTIVAEEATTIYKMYSTEFTVMNKKVQNFQRSGDLDVKLRDLWMEK